MAYTTLLVHLEIEGDCTARVTYATALARTLDAYLIGFAACGVRPVVGEREGLAASAEVLAQRRKANRARLAELEQQFLSIAGGLPDTAWRQAESPPTEALLLNARAADLVVSGTPHGPSVDDVYRAVDPAVLLAGAGRPVLLVGDEAVYSRPARAVVGWKDTAEARRAVSDALPLLRMARDVLVVTIADGPGARGQDDLADVVRFLMRHGVTARFRMAESDGDAGGRFAEIAREEGADLVVSGAYGHSRMQEWILGGFTRSLLGEKGLNRLMAG